VFMFLESVRNQFHRMGSRVKQTPWELMAEKQWKEDKYIHGATRRRYDYHFETLVVRMEWISLRKLLLASRWLVCRHIWPLIQKEIQHVILKEARTFLLPPNIQFHHISSTCHRKSSTKRKQSQISPQIPRISPNGLVF
jgi:hypothetical protein